MDMYESMKIICSTYVVISFDSRLYRRTTLTLKLFNSL